MITVNDVPLLNCHTFPGGEVRVQLDFEAIECAKFFSYSEFHIKAKVKNSDDLIALIHTIEILFVQYGKDIAIFVIMNYLPYARQDRNCNRGEINGLKWIFTLLDSMGIRKLTMVDVHNPDALGGATLYSAYGGFNMLIENINVTDILLKNIPLIGNYNYIVSPDEGSRSKIRQIVSKANRIFQADDSNPQVRDMMKDLYQIKPVHFNKVRVPQSGKIESITISEEDSMNLKEAKDIPSKKFLVVDDICDGGGTFIPISRNLKMDFDVRNIDLFVTHGIFSKGLIELLEHYDNIITTDSFYERFEIERDLSVLQRNRIKVIKL